MNNATIERATSADAPTFNSNPTPNPLTPEQAAFVASLQVHRRCVRAAIRSVLLRCGDLGLGADPVRGERFDPIALQTITDEIESDVWASLLENVDAWMRPGPAKHSTRLAGAARFAAMAWKKILLRNRVNTPRGDTRASCRARARPAGSRCHEREYYRLKDRAAQSCKEAQEEVESEMVLANGLPTATLPRNHSDAGFGSFLGRTSKAER